MNANGHDLKPQVLPATAAGGIESGCRELFDMCCTPQGELSLLVLSTPRAKCRNAALTKSVLFFSMGYERTTSMTCTFLVQARLALTTLLQDTTKPRCAQRKRVLANGRGDRLVFGG